MTSNCLNSVAGVIKRNRAFWINRVAGIMPKKFGMMGKQNRERINYCFHIPKPFISPFHDEHNLRFARAWKKCIALHKFTYILPIFRLFFSIHFLGLADFFCLFKLLLRCLEQIARFNRDELHRIDSRLWWSSFGDTFLLNVVCLSGWNLQTRILFRHAIATGCCLNLPFSETFRRRFHSDHLSHHIRWIGGCQEFHTKNIDCLCPSRLVMGTALFQWKYYSFRFVLPQVLRRFIEIYRL